MTGSSSKAKLVAALKKAGGDKISLDAGDPSDLVKKDLFIREMTYRQVVHELLDGTVPQVSARLIQGALVTGRINTSKRFRWAQAIAESQVPFRDLLSGVRHSNPKEGLLVNSWWTNTENGSALGTFNLRVLHHMAVLWDSGGKEDEVLITDGQPQGILLQVRVLQDPVHRMPCTVLLALIQDFGLRGTTEFSHQVYGLIPTRTSPGMEPSLEDFLHQVMGNRSSGRADLLLPDKHMQPLIPPGFAESSICLMRYEHLDFDALAKVKYLSKGRTSFLDSFKAKKAILVSCKSLPLWGDSKVVVLTPGENVLPREKILPEMLRIKMEIEFPAIAKLVIGGRGAGVEVEGRLAASLLEADGLDFPFLSNQVNELAQAAFLPSQEVESPSDLILDSKREATEVERLERDFSTERGKRIELEQKVQALNDQIDSGAEQDERTRARLDHFEGVFSGIRRSLGAGKDALAEDFPRRVAELAAQLSVSVAGFLDVKMREAALVADVDVLRTQVQTQADELKVLKKDDNSFAHDEEPTLSAGEAVQQPTENPALSSMEGPTISEDREIVPTYFSSFCSTTPLSKVKEEYSTWMLGLAGFSTPGRPRLGIIGERRWVLSDLLGPCPINLEARGQFKVAIRDPGNTWILRFNFPDTRVEGTVWSNIVRLTETGDGTRIEHGIVRLTIAHAQRPSPQDVPSVLQSLFQTAITEDLRKNLNGIPLELNRENIENVVNDVLLNPERKLPVLIVSRSTGDEELCVDPIGLGRSLQGMAVVCSLAKGCGISLTHALRAASVDWKHLGCWDGSVRVYLPGFTPSSDPKKHSLWFRQFLELKHSGERIRFVARKVAANVIELQYPSGFSRIIEDHDLRVAGEESLRISKSGKSKEQVVALQGEVRLLQEANQSLRLDADQVSGLRNTISQLEGLFEESNQERKFAQEDAEQQRQRAGKLAMELKLIKQKLPIEQIEVTPSWLLDGLIQEQWNPYGAYVRLLQSRYSDHVIFLPEALKSADECIYTKPGKPKKMLRDLVTKYYEALLSGEGDRAGIRIFGVDGFAAKENDTLSIEGERARTKSFEGKDWFMENHLKITKGGTPTTAFRVHFIWDSQNRRILVGHVGEHLPP